MIKLLKHPSVVNWIFAEYFFFFLSRAETSALSRCQYLITSNEPKIHIVWYVTCNLNMWVITVSSLGCLRCWRMAGQDGSGASGERGREGASMFWEPRQLLYEGFDQPSGYIEPESRVCVCVCASGACGGYSRVLLCLNPHLCVLKLLFYVMFLMSRLLKVCVCVSRESRWAWTSRRHAAERCEHCYLKVTVCARGRGDRVLPLSRRDRVRLPATDTSPLTRRGSEVQPRPLALGAKQSI